MKPLRWSEAVLCAAGLILPFRFLWTFRADSTAAFFTWFWMSLPWAFAFLVGHLQRRYGTRLRSAWVALVLLAFLTSHFFYREVFFVHPSSTGGFAAITIPALLMVFLVACALVVWVAGREPRAATSTRIEPTYEPSRENEMR